MSDGNGRFAFFLKAGYPGIKRLRKAARGYARQFHCSVTELYREPVIELMDEIQEALKDLEEQRAQQQKMQKEMQLKMKTKRRRR